MSKGGCSYGGCFNNVPLDGGVHDHNGDGRYGWYCSQRCLELDRQKYAASKSGGGGGGGGGGRSGPSLMSKIGKGIIIFFKWILLAGFYITKGAFYTFPRYLKRKDKRYFIAYIVAWVVLFAASVVVSLVAMSRYGLI